jgi:hypothetical protein
MRVAPRTVAAFAVAPRRGARFEGSVCSPADLFFGRVGVAAKGGMMDGRWCVKRWEGAAVRMGTAVGKQHGRQQRTAGKNSVGWHR